MRTLVILKAAASVHPHLHNRSHVCGRVPLIVKRLTDVISSLCSHLDANPLRSPAYRKTGERSIRGAKKNERLVYT